MALSPWMYLLTGVASGLSGAARGYEQGRAQKEAQGKEQFDQGAALYDPKIMLAGLNKMYQPGLFEHLLGAKPFDPTPYKAAINSYVQQHQQALQNQQLAAQDARIRTLKAAGLLPVPTNMTPAQQKTWLPSSSEPNAGTVFTPQMRMQLQREDQEAGLPFVMPTTAEEANADMVSAHQAAQEANTFKAQPIDKQVWLSKLAQLQAMGVPGQVLQQLRSVATPTQGDMIQANNYAVQQQRVNNQHQAAAIAAKGRAQAYTLATLRDKLTATRLKLEEISADATHSEKDREIGITYAHYLVAGDRTLSTALHAQLNALLAKQGLGTVSQKQIDDAQKAVEAIDNHLQTDLKSLRHLQDEHKAHKTAHDHSLKTKTGAPGENAHGHATPPPMTLQQVLDKLNGKSTPAAKNASPGDYSLLFGK